MALRSWLIVSNADAGSHADEAVEAASTVLSEAGDAEQITTAGSEELDAALHGLDGRELVVVGGDGSLHLAVARLRALELLDEIVVGLVPLGTGNDFARGLGLDIDDAAAAARHLVGAAPRRLDLAVTDADEVVVNAGHAGIGARAAERSEALKDRLGNLAYPAGALAAGVADAGDELRIEVDGNLLHEGPTLMVGICNGPSIGGGTLLAPAAVPDDGRLDVVVATGTGPVQRAAFARALRAGEHCERDDVRSRTGTDVRVSGDPVPHDLDGEVTPARASCTYVLQPGAWSFRG